MSVVKEFVRQTKKEDIQYLIDNIRPEDVEELKEWTGLTVDKVLSETPDLTKTSHVWVVNGKVVCMFGVSPLPDHEKTGMIWMLATSEFEQYSTRFALRCSEVVKKTMDGYEYVFNYIHSKNKASIKWLKWLGFNVQEAQPIGIKGANFNRFELLNV